MSINSNDIEIQTADTQVEMSINNPTMPSISVSNTDETVEFNVQVLTNQVSMTMSTDTNTTMDVDITTGRVDGVNDVLINNNTIVTSGAANIYADANYSATNKLATMASINTDNLIVGLTEFIIDGGGPA